MSEPVGAVVEERGEVVGPDVLEAIRRCWGFGELRPGQARAIRAGIEGRDSLVVMPTGGGKSLCYQAPALVRGDLSVVVSPLISLMKDQVDGLRACGYPAVAFHSLMSGGDARDAARAMEAGDLRLVFVAPERLLTDRFLAMLERVGVASFVIDEAHCVSHWGHDFRPEYRQLARLKERFPHAALHAFTATATRRVQEDIIEQLGLRDPEVMIGHPDRPNLTYRVLPRVRPLEQLTDVIARHEREAVIVYCISRKETERAAAYLRSCGIRAESYHAGMEAADRRRVQDAFMGERLDVVVATVAFGMGVDRSNVRCVVHMAMPKSIEHYQQESGRAGRDGLEAECVLLYSPGDVPKWRRLMEMSVIDAGGDPATSPSLRVQLDLLEHMRRFCNTTRCRHATLAAYFGHTLEGDACGACDVCLGEFERDPEATVTAQKILSCVARLEQRWEAGHVVDVLRGSRSERIQRLGHDRLSTHGILRGTPSNVLRSYVDQLVDAGLLERTEGTMPLIRLTGASIEVLRNEREATLFRLPGTPDRAARVDHQSWEGVDRALFERLRALRRRVARERAVTPEVVFGDTSLREMARVRPGSLDGLRMIVGVGQMKLDEFGEQFLHEIRLYCREKGVRLDAGVGSRASARTRSGAQGFPVAMERAFELFRRGESVEDVVRAVGRSERTVAGYLEAYIERRRPESIAPWVDDATYQQVACALAECGDGFLKPVHERLGGRISYDVIRVVRARERTKPTA